MEESKIVETDWKEPFLGILYLWMLVVVILRGLISLIKYDTYQYLKLKCLLISLNHSGIWFHVWAGFSET